MKKTNFLKIVMTLVMAFVITGAFAQIPTPTAGDYTDGDVTTTTKVTVGTTMPLWVDADDYFNPDWAVNFNAAATNAAKHDYVKSMADINSTFTWLIYEFGDATKAAIVDLSASTGNYVEIDYSSFTAGTDYVVEVYETASTCPGPTKTLTVNVVAEPTMAFVTTDQSGCSPVNSSIVADVNGDVADGNIHLFWTYSATNVDSDWDGTFPINASYNPVDVTGDEVPVVTDADYATGTPESYAGTGNQTVIAARDWAALNNQITIYEFTLEGVTDKVSRKSDYLNVYNDANYATDASLYTLYDTAETIRIRVNPAPVTGPIYHIPNTWGM